MYKVTGVNFEDFSNCPCLCLMHTHEIHTYAYIPVPAMVLYSRCETNDCRAAAWRSPPRCSPLCTRDTLTQHLHKHTASYWVCQTPRSHFLENCDHTHSVFSQCKVQLNSISESQKQNQNRITHIVFDSIQLKENAASLLLSAACRASRADSGAEWVTDDEWVSVSRRPRLTNVFLRDGDGG